MATQNSNANADLVRSVFDAIQRNQLRTFWSLMSEDVVAEVSEQGPLSGRYVGQGYGDHIPCQILDKLEDFHGPTRRKPAGEEPEQPPDAPPKPVAGGYARMVRVAVLADDQYAATVYIAPSRTDVATGVIGVVVARIKDGSITNVWHHKPMENQDLSFLAPEPEP